MKRFFKTFLFPFAILYDVITRIRNFLFDQGLFKTYVPPVFSIGVGNLSVGGTGKTPFISFLIEAFEGQKIAVLSRGYGRNTKGYLAINKEATPDTVGDEMYMLFQKHQSAARFFVCENRKTGVENLLAAYPDTKIILFDDVFQHRHVSPQLLILLTTYAAPFFKDYLLPFGRLREARKGARRADLVVVTKSQRADTETKKGFEQKIVQFIPEHTPVYFNYQAFDAPSNIFDKKLKSGENVKVISGIADNESFAFELSKQYQLAEKHFYADHHHYQKGEILAILHAEPSMPIVTTEKDFVKIKFLLSVEQLALFYVLKLTSKFSEKESEFLRKFMTDFKSFQDRKGSLNNG